MSFLIFLLLLLSCNCSISHNPSIPDSTLMSIFSMGDTVLKSAPFSFEFAKVYIKAVRKLILSTDNSLTKEDLRVMELQTELVLAHLELSERPKSSFEMVYYFRRWRLRKALKEVIDDLQFQMRFAMDSSCSSLVALNSMVNQELVNYRVLTRNDRDIIEKLIVLLKQFKKGLSLCQNSTAMSMKDEQKYLLYLFTAGYSVLEVDSLTSESDVKDPIGSFDGSFGRCCR
jgi:hypothetical protein